MEQLAEYYKRYNPKDNYENILFRSSKGLQSAELNDLQAYVDHKARRISDAVLKDGNIIEGGNLTIDLESKTAHISKTSVYLRGSIRDLEKGEVVIPTNKTVYVGVWLSEKIITEKDDRNLADPAVGTHNYQQAGAARLQVNYEWGIKAENKVGNFYPIFRIDHGNLIVNTPPPQLEGITVAIARYDRESNGGNYVVKGMEVIQRGFDEDKQVFGITEGKAHIDGFTVQFPSSVRRTYDLNYDLQTIVAESHYIKGDKNSDLTIKTGKQRINLHNAPLNDIRRLEVMFIKEEELNRSNASNEDLLPDNSVMEILSIKQGRKQYVEDKDYEHKGNKIRWSLPNGKEPKSGTTYKIIYKYRTLVDPIDLDDKGFSVENVAKGSYVVIDYQWRLPRIDLITLDKEGDIQRVKGLPSQYNPQPPHAPQNQFVLALVKQSWWSDQAPIIKNLAVRTVSMSELKLMQQQIQNLYELVSMEQLKNRANSQESGIKKGMFVDPFNDDSQRDLGIEQDAAIINQELVLPIDVTLFDLKSEEQKQTLDFEFEAIINQPMHTGSMKVNPYSAFEPIPPRVNLNPQIDTWTEGSGAGKRTSSTTSRFLSGIFNFVTNSVNEYFTKEEEAKILRVRDVKFHIKDFGAKEKITEVLFDGVKAQTKNIVYNGKGEINGSFTIPNNIPTGTKPVVFKGPISTAQTTFTGKGTIKTNELKDITSMIAGKVDPLAQTFSLKESRFIAAVDLWFVKKGKTNVRVQIRETAIGMPTSTILSEEIIYPEDISLEAQTTVSLPLVFIQANVSYAVVILSDDAEYEVKTAKIGEQDFNKNVSVQAQPYQVGVLLSSSNAETWTPHQDMDLTFTLYAAKFTQNHKVIEYEEQDLSDISDIIALSLVERTSSETDIRFKIENKDEEINYELQDNQTINLTKRINTKINISAHLYGSSKYSPILYSGAQMAFGTLKKEASYVSRLIPCGTNSKLSIFLEADIKNSGIVEVYAFIQNEWMLLEIDSSDYVEDNWQEQKYQKNAINDIEVRVKIILKGDAANRPKVRNLRVLTT